MLRFLVKTALPTTSSARGSETFWEISPGRSGHVNLGKTPLRENAAVQYRSDEQPSFWKDAPGTNRDAPPTSDLRDIC